MDYVHQGPRPRVGRFPVAAQCWQPFHPGRAEAVRGRKCRPEQGGQRWV